ncbi:hypothetical protein B0T26DRAFT_678761 [Lasiosphaeria miniovina]|uniref:Uncharacterized protein n=1 Tax=Lasiosphaeria miniovina TaxID=1954250 RepID=A0AA40A4V3_9PEZI|nr:uncharacterized protein B0T26DRAFT_678761 [Lasiosphaeria miniovina]KAK0709319.1 hypothetical protein B0T26DRAFT_678761 [Lasiosphaeria miniovina]
MPGSDWDAPATKAKALASQGRVLTTSPGSSTSRPVDSTTATVQLPIHSKRSQHPESTETESVLGKREKKELPDVDWRVLKRERHGTLDHDVLMQGPKDDVRANYRAPSIRGPAGPASGPATSHPPQETKEKEVVGTIAQLLNPAPTPNYQESADSLSSQSSQSSQSYFETLGLRGSITLAQNDVVTSPRIKLNCHKRIP